MVIETIGNREILYFILALIFILLLFIWRKNKLNRHKYNWKKAIEIREKLEGFNGENFAPRILSYLRKIDPFVFEELLLYSFKEKGAKIIRNDKYTGDGGIDGRVVNSKGKSLIQAKRYGPYINLAHVKEFGELIKSDRKANHGYFIHTGKTGKGVYEILKTENYNITIISGSKLIDLVIPQNN